RVLKQHSTSFLAARAFAARESIGLAGAGHLGFDALERETGLSRTFRVAVDPSASIDHLCAALNDLDGVEMASPHYLCEAIDAEIVPAHYDTDESYALIGARAALEREPGDETVVVALIDSGVADDHPELTGRMRPGFSTVDLDAEQIEDGVRLLSRGRKRGPNIYDDEGHGTHCAGLLRARGIKVPPGLGGDSRLLPMRALCGAMVPDRERPTAIGSLVDIDEAFKLAVDLGARVLNLSFGTRETEIGKDDPVPHAEVVSYALGRGCVLVAASGNDGDTVRFFPAALPGVIAVGACDGRGRPTHFSSRGDHVAVTAPGEALSCVDIAGYKKASGTSFAAPLVSGAAALMLAHAARYSVPLQPTEVRRLLVESARKFPDGVDGHGHGAGVLDARASLDAVAAHCRSFLEEPVMGLLANQGGRP
ncbi:MAG TPA: S8 family serine peptidase, partial [Polyangia bacterium]